MKWLHQTQVVCKCGSECGMEINKPMHNMCMSRKKIKRAEGKLIEIK